MKKITVFIGTPRKQATYQAVAELVANLQLELEIECEYVFLNDYHLANCLGCKACFDKGEEYCPLQDDRDLLLEKLQQSDGVILATPNYAFQVTALLKNLLDRLSFILHRPRFFGKAFTAVVAQAAYGGSAIVKYLETIGKLWGFTVAKGCTLTALDPKTALEQQKITRIIKKACTRFAKELKRSEPPAPSFFQLMLFRISRDRVRMLLDEKFQDYRYYQKAGWFESAYYYPIRLGFVKKAAGHFFDFLGVRLAGKGSITKADSLSEKQY